MSQSNVIATPVRSTSSSTLPHLQVNFLDLNSIRDQKRKKEEDLIFVEKERRSDTLKHNQLSFWLELWELTRNQSDVRPCL
jgi:hypothetical protein